MSDTYRHISALIHGDFGSGKTMAAGGFPGPALVFDCEGGFEDVPGIRRVHWDPRTEPVPEFKPDEDDLFIMVDVREWSTLNAAYDYIVTRQLKVESVIFDSLTEMQRQLQESIKATGFEYWGKQLETMTKMIRRLRDMVRNNEINLCFVTSSDFETVKIETDKKSYTKAVPLLQGALRKQVAGFFDLFGFMEIDETSGKNILYLRPSRTHAAKCRLHALNLAHPEGFMAATLDPPTVSTILDIINRENV